MTKIGVRKYSFGRDETIYRGEVKRVICRNKTKQEGRNFPVGAADYRLPSSKFDGLVLRQKNNEEPRLEKARYPRTKTKNGDYVKNSVKKPVFEMDDIRPQLTEAEAVELEKTIVAARFAYNGMIRHQHGTLDLVVMKSGRMMITPEDIKHENETPIPPAPKGTGILGEN